MNRIGRMMVAGLVVASTGGCGEVDKSTTDDAPQIDAVGVVEQPDAAPVLTCNGDLIACGDVCIDPATDNIYCGASGACVGGTTCTTGSTCIGGSCVSGYSPVGPQFNVDVSLLEGWTLCSLSGFGSTIALADIEAACPGSDLMLACRPAGASVLPVLAWAPRGDVLTDTGTDLTTTHEANGTAWYFNASYSWGYTAAGDAVNKQSCDYKTTGQQRLCWHTAGGAMTGGYRCGDATDLLDDTYERLVFTR